MDLQQVIDLTGDSSDDGESETTSPAVSDPSPPQGGRYNPHSDPHSNQPNAMRQSMKVESGTLLGDFQKKRKLDALRVDALFGTSSEGSPPANEDEDEDEGEDRDEDDDDNDDGKEVEEEEDEVGEMELEEQAVDEEEEEELLQDVDDDDDDEPQTQAPPPPRDNDDDKDDDDDNDNDDNDKDYDDNTSRDESERTTAITYQFKSGEKMARNPSSLMAKIISPKKKVGDTSQTAPKPIPKPSGKSNPKHKPPSSNLNNSPGQRKGGTTMNMWQEQAEKQADHLVKFTGRTFAFAEKLIEEMSLSNIINPNLVFSSNIPTTTDLNTIPNPYPSATTIGHFWGSYFTEFFVEILETMDTDAAIDGNDRLGFGGDMYSTASIVQILHTLDILGKVALLVIPIVAELPDEKVKCSRNDGDPRPVPAQFNEQTFLAEFLGSWKQYVGKTGSDNRFYLEVVGLLRFVGIRVTRSLIQHRKSINMASQLKNFQFTEDHLESDLGFTFGCHGINVMVRNIYEDCKYLLQEESEKVKARNKSDISAFGVQSPQDMGSRTRRREKLENDPNSVQARPKIHVFLFGEKNQAFDHEGCTLSSGVGSGSVNMCDGCASNFLVKCSKQFDINTFKLPSDVDTQSAHGNVFNQTRNLFSQDWFCPLCQSGEKLLEAVEENRMDLLNSLVLFEVAAPHYTKRILNVVMTPLHTAALQNNYEVLSMLLYGASVLIKLSETKFSGVLPLSLPQSSWPRDAEDKTPFEAAYDISVNPTLPARTDALLLLAARGCGNFEMIESLTIKKINVFNNTNAILEGAGVSASPDPAYPASDISMGMERFKIPWVNETRDGDRLTTKNFLAYISRSIESRSSSITWYSHLNPTVAQNSKGAWKKQPFLKSWPTTSKLSQADMSCTSEIRVGQLMKSNGITAHQAHFMDCNFLCPCYASPRSSNLAFSGRKDFVQCENQRQYGCNYPLEIFKTSDGRGWGARTPAGVTIPVGVILCSYSGIYEDEMDVDELEEKYHNEQKPSFIMNLHKEKKQTMRRREQFVDDATNFRGVAGFFNHTCDGQNIKQLWGYKDHLDTRFPRVSFVTEKEIPPLTEIMFNYGDEKSVECLCSECNTRHCMCTSCKRLKCGKKG
ncbi:hypothetical protein TrVE_jg7742 [Triparma verrucosa]|uniref:SET domain-containing protein n=1 Tax=Triparma verrucosa TaxID=1606542 RepID=A0A9W7EKH8_9STRA|nr:hypothetical protein TrVE_jg7742 [Triparma verrucosa]